MDGRYNIPIVNGVPAAIIQMAAAHRAWALKHAPWLIFDV